MVQLQQLQVQTSSCYVYFDSLELQLTRTAKLSVLHPAMLHSLLTSGELDSTLIGPTTMYRGGPTRRYLYRSLQKHTANNGR